MNKLYIHLRHYIDLEKSRIFGVKDKQKNNTMKKSKKKIKKDTA